MLFSLLVLGSTLCKIFLWYILNFVCSSYLKCTIFVSWIETSITCCWSCSLNAFLCKKSPVASLCKYDCKHNWKISYYLVATENGYKWLWRLYTKGIRFHLYCGFVMSPVALISAIMLFSWFKSKGFKF